jgi:hypothetical protein
MGYKFRQFTTADKFSQTLTLDALDHALCREDNQSRSPRQRALKPNASASSIQQLGRL